MNQLAIRAFGVAGILGGITLFTGDMLLYFNNNSTNLLVNMSQTNNQKIVLSGVTALIATWFYLLGLIHVNYAFKPTSNWLRFVVIALFAGILTAYGVVHGAFIAIATSAKLASEYNLDLKTATELASQTNNAIRLFVYPLFAVLSVVFFVQVWTRKTLYPRWMLLFFPLVPFMFQGLIARLLSGSLWVVVMGGFLNIILILFFTASTFALWKK